MFALPTTRVSYISFVFSNVRSVLSQCNTRLRRPHLPYDIEVLWRKTIKHALFMFCTLIKHGFRPIIIFKGRCNNIFDFLLRIFWSSNIHVFQEDLISWKAGGGERWDCLC